MGAVVSTDSIVPASTGEVTTPTEPVTVTQSADNGSTGAHPYPTALIVTGSHWAEILDPAPKARTKPKPASDSSST